MIYLIDELIDNPRVIAKSRIDIAAYDLKSNLTAVQSNLNNTTQCRQPLVAELYSKQYRYMQNYKEET